MGNYDDMQGSHQEKQDRRRQNEIRQRNTLIGGFSIIVFFILLAVFLFQLLSE